MDKRKQIVYTPVNNVIKHYCWNDARNFVTRRGYDLPNHLIEKITQITTNTVQCIILTT